MKKIITGLALVLALLGCHDENASQKTPEQPAKLHFNIDASHIDALFTLEEFGIQLHPPKDWKLVSVTQRRQLREQTIEQRGRGEFSVEPIEFFFNPENESLLSLTQISSASISQDNLLEVYDTFIASQLGDSQNQRAEFLKDGIGIIQYLLQNKTRVAFKLLLVNPQNKIIELDYIVSRSVYTDQIRAIESSIGTIQYLSY